MCRKTCTHAISININQPVVCLRSECNVNLQQIVYNHLTLFRLLQDVKAMILTDINKIGKNMGLKGFEMVKL